MCRCGSSIGNAIGIHRDRPEHTRLRTLASNAFTAAVATSASDRPTGHSLTGAAARTAADRAALRGRRRGESGSHPINRRSRYIGASSRICRYKGYGFCSTARSSSFVPRAFPLGRLFQGRRRGCLALANSSASRRHVPGTLRCLARFGSKVFLKPAWTPSPVSRDCLRPKAQRVARCSRDGRHQPGRCDVPQASSVTL
jgi:hypothetical protein